MVKSLVFVALSLISSASWAQTGCFEVFKQLQSEPVEAYLSLVNKNSSPELISEAANTILANYKLSIEDFLLLHNMGEGGNFNNHVGQKRLQELSEEAPLTPDQITSYLKTLDAQDTAVFFWDLAPRKAYDWSVSYHFKGTSADWVSLFIGQYRRLGVKEGQLFANQVFSTSIVNSGSLKMLDLTVEQLTEILSAMAGSTLGTGSLSTLLETYGLATLSQIHPVLLFSRVSFPNPRAPGFKENQKHEVTLQIMMLLGQDMAFLNSLKDSRIIYNIAPEALVEVLRAKKEAYNHLGEAKEKLALEYLDQLFMIISSQVLKSDILLTYKLAQDLAANVRNKDVLNELFNFVREVEYSIIKYENNFHVDMAREFLLGELPKLEFMSAREVNAFFAEYLKVVDRNYYEIIEPKIISNRAIIEFILQSGAALLQLNAQRPMTEKDIQLYIELRMGDIVEKNNPNFWDRWSRNTKWSAMTHEEAVAYMNAQRE